MERISKENYYLDIAQTVLERATCLRRIYGAIIVKNDEIISTGYNGAPRGRRNCVDMGYCTREALRVPRGERYELCRSVHAGTWWAAPCIWWAKTPKPGKFWAMLPAAPCAGGWSSMRALFGW